MSRLSKPRIRVMILDDHTLFLEGTVDLLSSETNLEVVGVAKDGNECLALLKTVKPDVVLLDINLPDVCGVDLIPEIKCVHPEASVLMLTGHDPEGYITISFEKGARGFLLKDCSKQELIEGIISVAQGKDYFCQSMASFLKNVLVRENKMSEATSSERNENDNLLSPREAEVMNLVSKGLSNNEIALTLGLKSRTINFHVGNILQKLGVRSRLQAVAVWKSAVEEKGENQPKS